MTATEKDPAKASTKSEKKKAKRKKHVSKHVLQAQKDMQEKKDELARKTLDNREEKPKKKKKKKKEIKDPSVAAEYLTMWKTKKGEWKFNKNTQSWLCRHMYEADKVAKGTFGMLLEYLEGLQGGTAKQRIVEDATKRALRYKEFEKNGAASKTEEGKDEEHDLWAKLSDHDKRKEYKRARKVLDTLKEG